MGTSGGKGVLSTDLLSVHTYCFPCPLPWLLALSSESPSFLFPCIPGPCPCKQSTLSCLSCSAGRQVSVPRLGQLVKVSLPGLIPRWLLAPEAGSLSGAVGGWRLDQQELGASGPHWSWVGSMAYHMWAHMAHQMHTRAAWVSLCLCVLHLTSGSCFGFRALKSYRFFLLGSGTRVGL